MSILGRAIKGTTSLLADGLDLAINKGTQAIDDKYGRKGSVHAVSEVGSTAVRVSKRTLTTLTDVADGGLETAVGYLRKNKSQRDIGIARMKKAGKDTIGGVGKGLAYTWNTGVNTATSAVEAGKYFVQGNTAEAHQEFAKTKGYMKDMTKVLAVGALAVGVLDVVDIIGDDVAAAEINPLTDYLPGIHNGMVIDPNEATQPLIELGCVDGTDHIFDPPRDMGQTQAFLQMHGFENIPAGYEIHHIVPLAEGGADTPQNMVLVPEAMHDQITAAHCRFYGWNN